MYNITDMKILFLGVPGSGKSTQGQIIANEYNFDWISTGELLRASDDPEIKEILKTAKLVDDEIVIGLALENMMGKQKIILDGFPRNLAQAEALVAADEVPEYALEIMVPLDELLERMRLRGRDQDTDEIVRERVKMYETSRDEILNYLTEHGMILKRVDGVGTIEEITDRIKNELKEVL